MINHLIAIGLAFFIDDLIGDPPTRFHPVRLIGSLIAFLERKLNREKGRKAKGILMVIIVVSVVFALSYFVVSFLYFIHPVAGIAGEGMIIAATIACRNLKEAAEDVYLPLKEGNMAEAREKLSWIVGRDTDQLDEGEIVRAAVETVAENTSDGVTAPLFWAFIGGAPLAAVYRAINTCDSMAGYKNERFIDFGWASARLDDVVNYIPSRLTGMIMIIVNKPMIIKRKDVWKQLFTDGKKHPSPNSGWLEGAMAALLGVQLGGVNYYKGIPSYREKIGISRVPLEKEHIIRANRILTKTTVMFIIILWIGGIFFELARTWL